MSFNLQPEKAGKPLGMLSCLLSFVFQSTTDKQNRRRRDVKEEVKAKDVCSFSVQYF